MPLYSRNDKFFGFGTLSDDEMSAFMVLEFPSQFSSAVIEQILRSVAGYSSVGERSG